jgi:hypothetical protein
MTVSYVWHLVMAHFVLSVDMFNFSDSPPQFRSVVKTTLKKWASRASPLQTCAPSISAGGVHG